MHGDPLGGGGSAADKMFAHYHLAHGKYRKHKLPDLPWIPESWPAKIRQKAKCCIGYSFPGDLLKSAGTDSTIGGVKQGFWIYLECRRTTLVEKWLKTIGVLWKQGANRTPHASTFIQIREAGCIMIKANG